MGRRTQSRARRIGNWALIGLVSAYWLWFSVYLNTEVAADKTGLFWIWFGWFYGGGVTLAGLCLLVLWNLGFWLAKRARPRP